MRFFGATETNRLSLRFRRCQHAVLEKQRPPKGPRWVHWAAFER